MAKSIHLLNKSGGGGKFTRKYVRDQNGTCRECHAGFKCEESFNGLESVESEGLFVAVEKLEFVVHFLYDITISVVFAFDKKVEKGEFRADLFYRINVFPIEVPTLSARTVDVPVLIQGIIEKIKFSGQDINVKFSEDALKVLSNYNWPGNVRELRNVIERASVLFNDRSVSGENVKENLLRLKVPDPDEEQDELWAASTELADFTGLEKDEELDSLPIPNPEQYKDWFLYFDKMDLRKHLRDIEIVMIEAALEKTDGMVSHASDALKLRRTTLIEKMKKYGISK